MPDDELIAMGLALLRSQLFGMQPAMDRRPATAAITAGLLGDLASERYTVSAWRRFWRRSWVRSMQAAGEHPRAVDEAHELHAFLLAASGDPRIAISWVLTWTHVGLLQDADGLGLPNALSLVRANLPLLVPRRPRVAAIAALASDFGDGIIARRTHRETTFGAYADSLADSVFWTWFAWRFEADRRLRLVSTAFWLTPPLLMAVLTFGRGRMLVLPRPRAVRLASAMLQLTLTARAFRQRDTA